MKRKSFLQQFMSLGIGSAIYLLVGLIGTPVITRLVDPVAYGDYSIFNMYSNFGFGICVLGLDQAFVRYYYSHESIHFRSKLLYECMVPAIIATAIMGGIIGTITIAISGNGINRFSIIEIVLIVLNMMFLVLNRYSTLSARLQNDTNTYSAIGIVQKSLFLVMSVVLVLVFKSHFYEFLMLATIISTLLASLMGIWKERFVWFPKTRIRDIPSVSRRELYQYGIPLLFSFSVTLLFNALDKLALDRFCTRADVGVYTSALNLLAVFTVIRSSFNALWIPSAVEYYENNPDDRSFYQKGHAFVTVLMLLFGAGMIMCKDLFVLLLGEDYREAALIFPFLMFEPIMYTISETTVTGLVVKKKSSQQIIVAVVACVTNFIGNWLLTPWLGPKGAAISTGFSYIVYFAMRTILSNKVFYVDYKLHKLVFMIVLLVAFAMYGSNHSFSILQVCFFAIYTGILLLVYFSEFKDAMVYGKQLLRKLVTKRT